ncbi:hypothetical protein [Ferrovibrio sp.]|uniref:hypothetical protein n=1 Tax=Ferrovibrio sp. TaxID=1917215 RepID=UPI003517E94D
MTDLLDIWNRGYSVAELWGHTSPPTSKSASLNDAKNAPDWGLLSAKEYYDGYGQGGAYALRQLVSGNWVAIGFKAPRTMTSSLMVIPKTVIAGLDLYDDDSTLAGSGLHFVGVHIVHCSLFDESTSIEPSGKRRKPGRPTAEPYIQGAFSALLNAGLIDLSAPTATHFSIIRKKIGELYPESDANNLSDKVLYKWLPSMIRAAINSSQ